MCLAVPGKILNITSTGPDPLWREGRVDFSGAIKWVSLACVPEAVAGQYVLVHAGMAISVVDEDEARAVLEHFQLMGEDDAPAAGDGGEGAGPRSP